MRIYNFILTYISSDIAAGSVTSLPIQDIGSDALKSGDVIRVYDPKSLTSLEFTLSADQTRGDTSLSVNSVTVPYKICYGAFVQIDQLDLLKQYQHKTRGTVAGFDIDTDGISKGGIEITGWLDSDTMTGATANNVPTAESVKAYVDNSSSSNYLFGTCSGTGLTSTTDGIANAVVVPFDTAPVASGSTEITLYGASGVTGISGSAYSFSLEAASRTGQYEIKWNVSTDTSVINNRYLCGVALQTGLAGDTSVTWETLSPSHTWLYNRGTGGNTFASGSNSIIYDLDSDEYIRIFRIVFWKEDGQATGKLITTTNGCGLTIKQL